MIIPCKHCINPRVCGLAKTCDWEFFHELEKDLRLGDLSWEKRNKKRFDSWVNDGATTPVRYDDGAQKDIAKHLTAMTVRNFFLTWLTRIALLALVLWIVFETIIY